MQLHDRSTDVILLFNISDNLVTVAVPVTQFARSIEHREQHHCQWQETVHSNLKTRLPVCASNLTHICLYFVKRSRPFEIDVREHSVILPQELNEWFQAVAGIVNGGC